MAPESSRDAVPPVALTVMATSAPKSTMATASRSRSRSVRNFARRSSVAASRGASVFPAAMPMATRGEGLIGRLTRKAATATPGHTRRPNRSRATRAIPVGGQMGVT